MANAEVRNLGALLGQVDIAAVAGRHRQQPFPSTADNAV